MRACVCVGGRHRGLLVYSSACASWADGQTTLRTCSSFISSNPLHSEQAETGGGIIPLSLRSKSTTPQADYHLLRQNSLSRTAPLKQCLAINKNSCDAANERCDDLAEDMTLPDGRGWGLAAWCLLHCFMHFLPSHIPSALRVNSFLLSVFI